MLRKLPTILVLICLSIFSLSKSRADDEHPIAIRQWSDTGFTIETMYNMHVGIGLTEADMKRLPRTLNLNADEVTVENPAMLRWSTETSEPLKLAVNEVGANVSPIEILVSKHNLSANAVTLVAVDGIVVAVLNGLAANEIDAVAKHLESKNIREKELVVIATSDGLETDALKKLSNALSPQTMVVGSTIEKIGSDNVEAISGNTIAIGKNKKMDNTETNTRFVSLGDQPWTMTDELAGLFAKKEAACKSSREMFAKLSVDQMNFKPSDGTHTPRWNAEHMMGRELLFFSQIFHAVDPSIPVMDLNPRQMPKDYTFAHPDWSGAEEAAQMMRVEAFTRRFGYLLDGMDLDKKAAGSKFWTPRGLLEQMERHYKQHSANVVKKMDLDGWPAP